MAEKTVIIETGGTFSMGKDNQQQLVPCYDVRHFALAAAISQSDSTDKKSLYEKLATLKTNYPTNAGHVADQLDEIASNIPIGSAHRSVYDLIRGYGLYDNIIHPYQSPDNPTGLIDSIDFDLQTHYPALKENILDVLTQGDNALVIGGTDTLEFYAKALAQDPDYQAYRRDFPNNANDITFVSSMLSFEASSEHVGKIFHAGASLAQDSVGGIYALSANNDKVEQITVHDLQQPFVKISGVLPDAFVSETPFGTFHFGDAADANIFERNADYSAIPTNAQGELAEKPLAVAPPLIAGNNVDAIAGYLQQLPDHIVIVEVDEALLTSSAEAIVDAVQQRTANGTPTLFVNDLAYDNTTKSLQSVVPEPLWKDNELLNLLSDAGGTLLSDTTTAGAYLDAFHNTFTVDETMQQRVAPTSEGSPQSPPAAIGIRYIPHEQAFRDGIDAIERIYTPANGQSQLEDKHQTRERTLIIQALPGEAIPARHVEDISNLSSQNIDVFTGFKYAGNVYETGKEGFTTPAYAAAAAMREHVTSLGTMRPQEKLEMIHAPSVKSEISI